MIKRIVTAMAAVAAVVLASAGCGDYDAQLEALRGEADSLQRVIGAIEVPEAQQPSDVPSTDFSFSFDKARYGVDAGGSVTVAYTLPRAAEVSVSAVDGWSASVVSSGESSGEVILTAPDPASPANLVISAVDAEGNVTAAPLPVMVRDPYTAATRTSVGSMAYFSLNESMANDYHYGKMADAGINMMSVEGDDNYDEHFRLAQKYGIKVVFFINMYTGRYYRDPDNYTGLDDIINKVKDYPALCAYQIEDEPSTDDIEQLAVIRKHVNELDPVHPVYLNLNSATASRYTLGVNEYEDYVESYVSGCGLELITFDQYPVYQGYIDHSWIKSLAIVRSTARRHGIPFWAFAQSCRLGKREDPTLATLRLQCNTNLAFGAQVNQYFVWRATSGTNYAPVMGDGSYTGAYDVCRDYNREMHSRGFVFAGCSVPYVAFTNVIQDYVDSFDKSTLPEQISNLETSGEAIVSYVENCGNRYVVVQNFSWQTGQTLTIEVEDMVYGIDREGVFTEYAPGTYDITIDEGDMAVFKIV